MISTVLFAQTVDQCYCFNDVFSIGMSFQKKKQMYFTFLYNLLYSYLFIYIGLTHKHDDKLHMYKDSLGRLPEVNRTTLKAVINHLVRQVHYVYSYAKS